MAETFPVEISSALQDTRVEARAAAVPWYVWTSGVSIGAITFGLYWDISWHMTIGRDTFWTPAHLLVQFGGILAAITCTYLIFSTTFGADAAAKSASVSVWGFRGPLGAFFTAWGGAMMVTSAPFDNWWHSAFGLDVQILSPPHFVLGLGINGVVIGSTLLVVSLVNRSDELARQKLVRILLYFAGLQLVLHMMLIYEYSDASRMHSPLFYRVMSIGVPLILIAFARAGGHRWGMTIIAAIYTVFMLTTTWTFPLFAASPKLGPVFTNVTHMLPLGFPMLVIAPAFAMDLAFQRMKTPNRWVQAAIVGTIYLVVMVAVHWPWADFMILPQARNWFWGMNNIPYFIPPSVYHFFYEFSDTETRTTFAAGMGVALFSAIVSSRIGIALGNAMKKLQR